ncbi:hypothetical protein [Roseateles sp. P5_E7]
MENLLAALGANALILGALTYLVKSFIGSRLERDLIEFKSAIERKASTEIDRFRSQLEKDRLRMQISYGGIFERQADAILALYGAVVALERGASEAIHLSGTPQERRNKFEIPLWELRRTIIDKKILLPPDVDTAIEAFLARLPRAVRTYISAEARDMSRLAPSEMDKLFEQQDRAMEIIENEVPALRGKLVAEMQKVIGVVANEF